MDSVDAQFLRWRTSGDLEALGAVYDAAAPGLLRMALHHVRHPAMAEDLVQTTFVAAIHQAARWDASRPLLGWLTGILANHAKWQQRREGRTVDATRLHAAEPADPLEIAAAAEFTAQCDAAIETLPEVYRPVLRLSLKHELQAAEIAHVLGRPAGTVRSQLTRGLEMLRAALPAGVALGAFAVLLPARGLPAVRGDVLAAAKPAAAATAATASVAVGAATSLWIGSITMKKVAVGIVLALVVGWWVMAPATTNDAFSAPIDASGIALSAREPSRGDPTSSTIAPVDARDRVAGDEAVGWAVTGRVVDADGRPANGARVDVSLSFGSDEDSVPSVVTDGDGRYRVDLERLRRMPPIDLARAKVNVCATASGHQLAHAAVEIAHRDPERALHAGADLALVAGSVVAGRVLGRDGEPVRGARVELRTDAAATVATGQSGSDGRFRVAAQAAGRGVLKITHLARGRAEAPCDWRERADTSVGDIVLRGDELLARVVFDNGEPAAGISLQVATDKSSTGLTKSVTTDAAGWVRVVPTEPTPHRVSVSVFGETMHCDLVPGATPPTFVLQGLRLLRFACYDAEDRPLHALDVTFTVWGPTNDLLARPPTIGAPMPIEKRALRGAGGQRTLLLPVGSFVHMATSFADFVAEVVVQAPVAPNVTDTRLVLRERRRDAGLRLLLSASDGNDVGDVRVRLEPLRLGDPEAYDLAMQRGEQGFEGRWNAGHYRLHVDPRDGVARWFARQSTDIELVANRVTEVPVTAAIGGRLRVRFHLPPERSGPVRGWTLGCPAAVARGPGELRSFVRTTDDGWVTEFGAAPAGVPLLWEPILPPGRHEVRITADGYADLTIGVDIRPRAVTDVDVHLQPR